MRKVPGPFGEYEHQLLAWLRDYVGSGLSILKKERGYTEIETALKYINGEQYPLKVKALSRIVDNRLKKVTVETVSALTDVRPIWNYESNDTAYDGQAEILSKLAKGWWRNSQADRRLKTILTLACAGGSAYGYLLWNPDLPGGGDFEILPLDPRNVIPIEPVYSDSIQDWRGVVIRQNLPITTVKSMFPLKAHSIGSSRGSWVEANPQKEGGSLYNVVSAAWTTLTRQYEGIARTIPDTVDLFHVYLKDDSVNTGTEPKLMGEPGTNWSYIVPPIGSTLPDGRIADAQDAALYPRGRYIIATQDTICKDGPNPYWHGNFPLVRFTLDALPGSLLGAPMIPDLIPLQNALNETIRGIEDGVGQWIRRGVIADHASMPKTTLDAMDTRKSGFKAYLRKNIGGQSFQILDGPTFPPWYMDMLDYFKNEIDELSGVRDLMQLAQLKQAPAKDTLDRFMDAMSPMIRLRAQNIETSLGELADLIKVGFFQYYDVMRRVEYLGVDGISLEDFDYDPNTLVPGPDDPLEEDLPREERAKKHHKNFKFSVAPNTFLNVSHTEQKMLVFQMYRANVADPWTLADAMDIQNFGKPPAETVVDRIIAARRIGLMEGPTPELVQATNNLQLLQTQMQLLQVQQMMGQTAAMGSFGPGGGGEQPPPGPGGVPPSSGIGPQGGRPPSGGQPPQMVQKSDGRTVVSESGR